MGDRLQRKFDPEQDWPPIGARVIFNGERFTFRAGSAPGWWSKDGAFYARPFSAAGQALASLWHQGGTS